MKKSGAEKHWRFVSAGVGLLLLLNTSVSGSFPTAQNVTWDSFNFKTLLTWKLHPINYSYTVEYSKLGGDNHRATHCIQMNKTECDLTNQLTDLKIKYSADVLSTPLKGMSSSLIEFPRTESAQFCPYTDTVIGSPNFNITLSEDERTMNLYIEDIPTALFDAQNKQRTIQDIFKNDLQYKVIYSKARSSGKKEKTSVSRRIEVTGLDRGKSYCFNVQVYIPTRKINKQLGELSQVQCFPAEDRPFYDDYNFAVIAGGILVVIIIISAVIAAIVIVSKRQKEAKNREKEGVPLKGV
ncbi:coagulation factor IIIa [Neoarius graeffei]|uniref:coagulation factor IIIa n=1 Tax=Neoarius graeffei TaxID=443677 RepID=UPI00298BE079|nr:coagulation factor IIIa [Neoarius graeffei]